MLDNGNILALFLFHGDGFLCKDFLALRIGTPEDIRDFLMSDSLAEVLAYGKIMGVARDKAKLNKIEKFSNLDAVTVEDIKSLKINLPGCCTCIAVAEDDSSIPEVLKKIESYVDGKKVCVYRGNDGYIELVDSLKNAPIDEDDEDLFRSLIKYNKYI